MSASLSKTVALTQRRSEFAQALCGQDSDHAIAFHRHAVQVLAHPRGATIEKTMQAMRFVGWELAVVVMPAQVSVSGGHGVMSWQWVVLVVAGPWDGAWHHAPGVATMVISHSANWRLAP